MEDSDLYIYILKLIKGKFYVGKTKNPNFRIEEHFKESGSKWTMIYQPLSLLELIPNCDRFDEDKYTLKYMNEFGIDSVRGGSWTQFKLSPETISHIQIQLASSSDVCYRCGRTGHFVGDCYAKTTIDGDLIEEDDDDENICYRCGRTGHFIDNCYAKTTIDGDLIEDDDDNGDENVCYRCGRPGHYARYCYARTDIFGNKIYD